MGGTRFMVQWEEHPAHLASRLGQLLEHQTLVDVTLMCNTHTLRVHRAVLAACSPYFQGILTRQLGSHPLIVLKDMQFSVLKSLIEFMYCGETSVTEDNLGPLLQAAKFFQVKGLSAMTKEALGLTSNTSKQINGDTARKAFVGRSKRVPVQQNFVSKALPTPVGTTSQLASASDTKQSLQLAGNSSAIVRQPDNQQQTDTAQLLLSLSGSEFHKQSQSRQSVTKGVRFQNVVGAGAMKSEALRCVESNYKQKHVKTEVEHIASGIPFVNKNVITSASHKTSDFVTVKEGTTNQLQRPTFVQEVAPVRKRGRPIKRQMNVVFQEKVLTDADMALHKEAEASRKALEVLRQEMAVEPREKASAINLQQTDAHSKIQQHSSVTKMPLNPVNSTFTRVTPRMQTTAIKRPVSQSNYAAKTLQKSSDFQSRTHIQDEHSGAAMKKVLPAPEPVSTQVGSTVAVTTSADQIHSNLATSNTNIIYQMPNQEMFQIVENSSVEDRGQNIVYQVAEDVPSVENETANNATNIVYQMADNTGTNTAIGQYMEALKGAGIPADIPIYLDSGDGSYVTLSEEMLLSMVNAGVLQCHVAEGGVTGERVEFIVQESDGEIQALGVQQAGQVLEQQNVDSVDGPTGDGMHQMLESGGGEAGPDMPSIGEDQPENILMQDTVVANEKEETDCTVPAENVTDLHVQTAILQNEQTDVQTSDSYNETVEENILGLTSGVCVQGDAKEENLSLEIKTEDSSSEFTNTKENLMSRHESSLLANSNSEASSKDEYFEQNKDTLKSECMLADGAIFTPPDENVEMTIKTEPEQMDAVSIADETVSVKEGNIDNKDNDSDVQNDGDLDPMQENGVSFSYAETTILPSLVNDYNKSQENADSQESSCQESSCQESRLNNVKEDYSHTEVDSLHADKPIMDAELESMMKDDCSELNKIHSEVIDNELSQVSDGSIGVVQADHSNQIEVAQANNCNQIEGKHENDCDIKSDFAFPNALPSSNLKVTSEETSECKLGDLRQSSEMSVEQALEAMMGDDSSSGVKETTNSNNVPENNAVVPEGSADSVEKRKDHSNNEELCRMLSRDDDTVKDSSASSGGELMGSFTLVVAPDGDKNEDSSSHNISLHNSALVPDPGSVITLTEPKNVDVILPANDQTEDVSSTQNYQIAVEHINDGLLTECDQQYSEGLVVQNNQDKCDQQGVGSHTEEVIEGECGDSETVIVQSLQEGLNDCASSDLQQSQDPELPEMTKNYVLVRDCKPEGQVISPNKDIPFAVGLLPVKTALEKFQSMPDHQPRKTRSSSTGKEGAPELSATRIKRKSSSADSGPDRKVRVMCDTEEELFEEEMEQNEMEEQENSSNWTSIDLNVNEPKDGLHTVAITEMVNEPTEV